MFTGSQLLSLKKTPKRKKTKRLKFEQKIAHIIHMMTLNAEELTRLRAVSGHGFSMSQIADMTRYERSTALMNDLYRAVDADLIRMHSRINPSNGLSPVTHYFYTLDEYKYALKQGRLFK